MATYTKTNTEANWGTYKATWTYTITGTENFLVQDSTFVYPYPTFKAKYVQNSSDKRNVGSVELYYLSTSVVVSEETRYWLVRGLYWYGNGVPITEGTGTSKTMTSGTTYTIPIYTGTTNIAPRSQQQTIYTANCFNSNNPTIRTLDVIGYPDWTPQVNGTSESKSDPASYWGVSNPSLTDFPNYKIGSIKLDVPPTATVGQLTKNSDVYYASATTVSVSISDLTAYYGGNFTNTSVYPAGVKLEIGSQSDERHDNGSLSIALNTVGTFTPKVTVTDSRGQTYVETFDPITVTEYKPTSHILNLQRVNAAGEPADDPAPGEASDEGTNAVVACQFDYPTITSNYMQAPIVKIDGVSPTNTVNWYTSWTESGGFSGQVTFSSYNPTRPVTLYGEITDTLVATSSYEVSVACNTTLGSGDADAQTLPQAFYLLSAAAGGHGLGVGMKVPPSANGQGLHVGMDATFYDDIDIASGAHYKINGSNLSAADVGALYEDANGDLSITRNITAGGDISASGDVIDGNGTSIDDVKTMMSVSTGTLSYGITYFTDTGSWLKKQGNVVSAHIVGTAARAWSGSHVIATLPSGYRPSSLTTAYLYYGATSLTIVNILTTGEFQTLSGQPSISNGANIRISATFIV